MSTNSCSTNPLQLQMLGDLPAQPPITFDLAIETREGWPLLTVETEMYWDSMSTAEKGPSLVGSLDSSCRYNRFLSCLSCSGQPSRKYYFRHHKLFISQHRPPTWAGRRAGSPVSVSLDCHSVMLEYLKYLQYVIV
jgi:hypothetical protein